MTRNFQPQLEWDWHQKNTDRTFIPSRSCSQSNGPDPEAWKVVPSLPLRPSSRYDSFVSLDYTIIHFEGQIPDVISVLVFTAQ